MSSERYSYRVFWSPEDREYVGVCSEFPGLSNLSKSPEAALKGIRELIASVVGDMRAEGRAVPSPLTEEKPSGQIHLRLPPNLHRTLVLEAAEQGRSLNRMIIDRLLGANQPAQKEIRAPEISPRKVAKRASKARNIPEPRP
jgi:predicted HicB family RNase H-like nuclease